MYVEYVEKIESPLKAYATKSLTTEFADGQSVRDYYASLFGSQDEFAKNRHRWRTPFQLDRDSILYSSLFSRLSEKTQLYTGRGRVENRMTHTLKVAQLARAICRSLFVNEDLGEAIAFGHDCGHTPFAHTGETALNSWLEERLGYSQDTLGMEKIEDKISERSKEAFIKYFTFSEDPGERLFMHGRQGVRLLTYIRKESVDRLFTKHTLFGIWRHSTKNFRTDEHFSYRQNVTSDVSFSLSGRQHSSIEGQVVRYADDIAWIISDITEGLRSDDLLKLRDIDCGFDESQERVSETKKAELMQYLRVQNYVALYTYLVTDLIRQSEKNLEESKGLKPEEAPKYKQFIAFSDEMQSIVHVLKEIIKKHLISAPWVYRGDHINKERIKALCSFYYDKPTDFLADVSVLNLDPEFPFKSKWYERECVGDPTVRAIAIADFVSILTDAEVSALSETVPRGFRT